MDLSPFEIFCNMYRGVSVDILRTYWITKEFDQFVERCIALKFPDSEIITAIATLYRYPEPAARFMYERRKNK